jgi:hypothetical protein
VVSQKSSGHGKRKNSSGKDGKIRKPKTKNWKIGVCIKFNCVNFYDFLEKILKNSFRIFRGKFFRFPCPQSVF